MNQILKTSFLRISKIPKNVLTDDLSNIALR